ncbi:hypothetical protein QE152_g23564 [Popillia japonica]|uniref:Uncharacterized protein n=1 Tax=Popillia japonica TaxID=7064 RepID=A0AAW1KI45_POPJA
MCLNFVILETGYDRSPENCEKSVVSSTSGTYLVALPNITLVMDEDVTPGTKSANLCQVQHFCTPPAYHMHSICFT